MSLTAGTVINHARDMHPALGPERSPASVCRRFLTRYQQELAGKIMAVRSDFFDATATTALPLATFDNGITLPANVLIKEAVAQLATDSSQYGQVPVELLPFSTRLGPSRFPAASQIGGTLLLIGKAEDWNAYASVKVRYTALPGDLTADGTALVLPDYALDACATALARFLLERLAATAEPPTVNPQSFIERAEKAEAACLELVMQQFAHRTLRIVEVF